MRLAKDPEDFARRHSRILPHAVRNVEADGPPGEMETGQVDDAAHGDEMCCGKDRKRNRLVTAGPERVDSSQEPVCQLQQSSVRTPIPWRPRKRVLSRPHDLMAPLEVELHLGGEDRGGTLEETSASSSAAMPERAILRKGPALRRLARVICVLSSCPRAVGRAADALPS